MLETILGVACARERKQVDRKGINDSELLTKGKVGVGEETRWWTKRLCMKM